MYKMLCDVITVICLFINSDTMNKMKFKEWKSTKIFLSDLPINFPNDFML